MNIKSNEIFIIRTHLGDTCYPTLFFCVFQTLLRNGWVVTVSPDKVESDKATLVVCVNVFISLSGLLMCAFLFDIFVTLPVLVVERIRKYFFMYRYDICVYHISILLYVD